MRRIEAATVTETVARLCREANLHLGSDMLEALRRAAGEREESPIGRSILDQIVANAELAPVEGLPICQDTGIAVVMVEIGQDVHIEDSCASTASLSSLERAIQEGVRRGYTGGYLRASVVDDPFLRRNTADNTPAVVHYRIVPGDRLRIVVLPKGAGAENMSAVRMLAPSDGLDGVLDFVVEVVDRAGPNACPPLVVGVGVGGTMEKAALLAKEALLRQPVGRPNPKPHLAAVEAELLRRINDLGIGPQGLGGRVTALAVHLETYPCHIASLPVAVNLQCHANRHREAVL
ncbi:MAG TPA: fumarate hydratase [Firmicutes bacterium]|nr:fumarate hydratase [Bacillota bacterium]